MNEQQALSGWTRHGHRIDGMAQIGKPTSVARCGGPSLCSKCAIESARRTTTMTAEQQGGDESGEGLSEAERESARRLIARDYDGWVYTEQDVERILADRLAAVQAELAHEREHNAYLQTELDAEAKHAALAEGETCDVCTHLESEQVQQWMTMDLDWQERAESAELALGRQADIEREAFGRGVEWASGAGMRQRWEAAESRAESAEAALATARRDAQAELRDALIARLCDCGDFDGHPGDCAATPVIVVAAQLARAALANPSAAQGEGEVPR